MRKILTALVITPEPAWPVKNGSDVRIHQLIRLMTEFCEFDVVTLASPFTRIDQGETRRQLGARSLNVIRHVPPRKQIAALQSLLTSRPMGSIMYRSELMRNAVAALSARNEYGVCLVFGGVCMAGYAANVKARMHVLDMCDDAALNKERRALVVGNVLARAFYRRQAKLIRAYRRNESPAFTRILTNSAVDAASLSRYVGAPVVTVPNTVDTGIFHPEETCASLPQNPLLLFVGAMNYRPNRDAVRWFTSAVMPLILRENPGARLQLVGPDSEKITIDSPSVVALGFAENLAPEYRKCDVFVCPLRAGTGIKNKMLEALSSGCAIVSTEIGMEGLDVRHEEHLLVANGPLEFASAVNRLLREPELRKRLGKAARAFTVKSLSRQSAGSRLRAAIFPDENLQERGSADMQTAVEKM
jgi:glycosyltransferase involved in cell wall biosynthesis